MDKTLLTYVIKFGMACCVITANLLLVSENCFENYWTSDLKINCPLGEKLTGNLNHGLTY